MAFLAANLGYFWLKIFRSKKNKLTGKDSDESDESRDIGKINNLDKIPQDGFLEFRNLETNEEHHLNIKDLETPKLRTPKTKEVSSKHQQEPLTNLENPNEENLEIPDKENPETANKDNLETPHKGYPETLNKENLDTPNMRNLETPEEEMLHISNPNAIEQMPSVTSYLEIMIKKRQTTAYLETFIQETLETPQPMKISLASLKIGKGTLETLETTEPVKEILSTPEPETGTKEKPKAKKGTLNPLKIVNGSLNPNKPLKCVNESLETSETIKGSLEPPKTGKGSLKLLVNWSGEALELLQNVYLGEEVEEPVFQYVPEKCLSPAWGKDEASLSELTPLQQSMLLLAESLESGAISGQFEQLYRRNPSIPITDCHLPENSAKNRYKDISPYDQTRVLLSSCPSGDYINANHVVVDIPGSGVVNRYIATQGPLSHTCLEFWYMVWEHEIPLLIMLTTVVERGRAKCHKYWPDLDSTVMYGSISVTCTREEIRNSFAYRDFTLLHADLPDDARLVSQMQYLSWPDHGTPDDSTEFVEFVDDVREMREKSATVAPTLVHCSAGIGRTGVLILMESALCLIEANQPVYPLDLTRSMRDQRPAMIQTPSQYRFVCEAITSVYKSGRVKPLPEFSA